MEKRTSWEIGVAHSSLLSLHTNMGNEDEIDQIWKKIKTWAIFNGKDKVGFTEIPRLLSSHFTKST
ncbi:unnamed protein product [Lupinus luteus]|uniref:Uncharacterized protein n=1 Tax=Lupinus luteus TaxID=3873 RepID=A0AAV1WPU8_LUPLU